jgi:hypothetical protein
VPAQANIRRNLQRISAAWTTSNFSVDQIMEQLKKPAAEVRAINGKGPFRKDDQRLSAAIRAPNLIAPARGIPCTTCF